MSPVSGTDLSATTRGSTGRKCGYGSLPVSNYYSRRSGSIGNAKRLLLVVVLVAAVVDFSSLLVHRDTYSQK